ncbi:MAG: ATP-binding cassette domain-containing protein [Clostridia bacterium]|nr:ATP-binding cassette domain-containing protein [Clostridia bacterium]
MEAIRIRGLTKHFEYYEKEAGLASSFKNLLHRTKLVREAVRGISFGIDSGEIVGFLGPNGAGKTTTLKMLSGILYPTAGEAEVLGFVPWERRKAFKMAFSIVMGQKSQLWTDLPAIESFRLNQCIYEIEEDAFRRTLDELTDLLDVRSMLKVQVRRLSLGERMKMELIAALLHRPRVLMLDEPTIGLDILSQRKIRDFIRYYNQQAGTTVLLTSHYMSDIEALCRRAVLINRGEVAYDGELAHVNDLFNARKVLRLQLGSAVDASDLARYGEVTSCDGASATIEIEREQVRAVSRAILDSLPVVDFTMEDIPIEEGIALLYQKGGPDA